MVYLPSDYGIYISSEKPIQEQTAGVKALLSEDLRWLRCDIKSLNLLYNVMEKQKASEAGAFEAILIRDGFVTEGRPRMYMPSLTVSFVHTQQIT